MKTKLLKTVCLFTFLLMAGKSFGQTKEETISWLQEQLSKYVKLDCKCVNCNCEGVDFIVQVEQCNIVIKYTQLMNNFNKLEGCSDVIPTKSVILDPNGHLKWQI